MYAIIENGSKQYKVAQGDVVKFEKLNAEVGEKVVDLPGPQKTKELILNLGARPEDQRMMLSEIEIWGE